MSCPFFPCSSAFAFRSSGSVDAFAKLAGYFSRMTASAESIDPAVATWMFRASPAPDPSPSPTVRPWPKPPS